MTAKEAIQQMWTLSDKPERMRCFHKIVFDLGVNDADLFWTNFWSIWSSSENLFDDTDHFIELIAHGLSLGSPHDSLDDDEKEALAAMPETVTVWRGCIPQNQHGWSWTTDAAKAKWFANRSAGSRERVLVRGTISRSDIVAFLTGRGESEVVANPDNIDYEIEETWEAESEGLTLFHAIQSGRFNMGDDRLRAQMMADIVNNDIAKEIASIEEALVFIRWADLRSKRGYLEPLLELLKEKQDSENSLTI